MTQSSCVLWEVLGTLPRLGAPGTGPGPEGDGRAPSQSPLNDWRPKNRPKCAEVEGQA